LVAILVMLKARDWKLEIPDSSIRLLLCAESAKPLRGDTEELPIHLGVAVKPPRKDEDDA